jgi:hypothetical protein
MVEITVSLLPNSPLTGTSEGGAGVTGSSNTGAGVVGYSVGSPPPVKAGVVVVVGSSSSLPPVGDGVQGTGENGVHGLSSGATGNGVLGENSSNGAGVKGTSVGGDGVYGQSSTGFGLHGRNTFLFIGGATPAPPTTTPPPLPPSAASTVKATECGIFGESLAFEGVFGTSAFQHGVHGVASKVSGFTPAYACGVWGESSAGYGVYATSGSTNGLWASSNADHGVHGETNSQTHAGIYAQNNAAFPCTALLASSQSGHGVQGVNAAGSGKSPPHGAGVWGDTDGGIGVYGSSKTGNAGQFDGNVSVSGQITAADVLLSGADCAEEFDAVVGLEQGMVAVFDDEGRLGPCALAYDKRVVGVVSGAGSYRPGIVLDRRASNRLRAPIALVGKVYCRADAGFGPIEAGDLLTTSATFGHAMRADDPSRAFGTIIGKALAPLAGGLGLIPVLVALR